MITFIRNKENSLENLDVGKVHLIKSWLDEMQVRYYVINDDLTIDVNSHVYLRNKNLIKFPDYIQFNKVDSYFDCSYNQLVTLKGCPKFVADDFYCYNNQLTSLERCPSYVGGIFSCHHNKKQFIENEFLQFCDVKGNVYV